MRRTMKRRATKRRPWPAVAPASCHHLQEVLARLHPFELLPILKCVRDCGIPTQTARRSGNVVLLWHELSPEQRFKMEACAAQTLADIDSCLQEKLDALDDLHFPQVLVYLQDHNLLTTTRAGNCVMDLCAAGVEHRLALAGLVDRLCGAINSDLEQKISNLNNEQYDLLVRFMASRHQVSRRDLEQDCLRHCATETRREVDDFLESTCKQRKLVICVNWQQYLPFLREGF